MGGAIKEFRLIKANYKKSYFDFLFFVGETFYTPETDDKPMDLGWATVPAGKVTGICEHTHITSMEGFFVNLIWHFKVSRCD